MTTAPPTQVSLNSFLKLPTPLPPQFLSLAYYDRGQRFVALWYESSKPKLSDGRIAQTFPYNQAFSPLVRHLSIEYFINRERAFLGSGDADATHALLLDTDEHSIYLGKLSEVKQFLQTQLPKSAEAIKRAENEVKEYLEKVQNSTSLKDLQQLGMFQFFAPVEDRRDEVEEMTKFLDSHQPPEISDLLKPFLNKDS